MLDENLDFLELLFVKNINKKLPSVLKLMVRKIGEIHKLVSV